MADLRALIESLGYRDVKTLLNSGNVVFTAPEKGRGDAAARIEEAMAAKLSVSTRVTVLTALELAKAINENPLLGQADNPSRLLVTVLNNPADRKRLDPVLKQDWTPEAMAIGQRVAYLWCPDGFIESPLVKAVDRALGDLVTSRNWSTMMKLNALAGGED